MSELNEQRARPVVPNHVTTVEVQSLHALLRIEETLTSILDGLRHFAKQQKTSNALDALAENDADLIDTAPAKVVNTKVRRK